MPKDKDTIRRLTQASLGEIKADLVVTGGRLINVYSGEVLEGMEMAVTSGRICYLGPSAEHTRGEETRVIDAQARWVAPDLLMPTLT